MFGQQTLTTSQGFALHSAVGLALLDGAIAHVTGNVTTFDLTPSG
jgi:hypothetical protein